MVSTLSVFNQVYTAVSGKVVLKKQKAYATILLSDMGRSDESVHVLNVHKIKKRVFSTIFRSHCCAIFTHNICCKSHSFI